MADLHGPSLASSGGSANLLGIYYDKVLLENLYPTLRFYQLAEKKPIPKGISNIITFSKITKYTDVTGNLTEGTPPSPTWLSSSQITATIVQKGAYTPLSDVLIMNAIDPIIEDAASELGRQAGSTIDKYIYYRCFGDQNSGVDAEDTGIGGGITSDWSNFYQQHPTAASQGFSTVFFSLDGSIVATGALLKSWLSADATAATAAEYGLTVDVIQRAVTELRKDDVPAYKDGNYVMVVAPESELTLLRDEAFKDWNSNQHAEKMWNGEIGRVGGARIVTSTNIAKTASAQLSVGTVNTAVFNVLMAPKGLAVTEIDGHIKMKVKPAGSAGGADPLDQVSTVGWKWTGVAKVVDEKRGKIIMTLTT